VSERFSRNEALLGAEGQAKIAGTRVGIVGVGGLGSHVAQQLAYLGVSTFTIVDFDTVDESNLNRLIGATLADAQEHAKKVYVAERLIKAIRPDALVTPLDAHVADTAVMEALATVDVIFGCVDRDIHRLEITELAARHSKNYFDLATDTGGSDHETYGGRVVLADGTQCLVCLPDLLNQAAIADDRLTGAIRDAHDRIYGIDSSVLDSSGPSVVSINGVVASLAVTEFMALVSGVREPIKQVTYYGHAGQVRPSKDVGEAGCFFCAGLWGSGYGT